MSRAVKERNERLRSAILALYEAAKEPLGRRAAGNLAHDALSDAYMLVQFAGKWETHCRITGQNPYRDTNADGSVRPLI